ncbi:phage tail protein [Niallia taxi]|uniref:phage tail protein n=1 Tax=Niallia taxi TaxID=2499688 RepID=UPI00254BB42D|nr:phage tail protein [Niallia taxi]MDK8641335.1 phage tail protein [Niallia taxi]
MYGIRFNGKHSYEDMGYTMPYEDREIGFSSKNKIIVTVPFSNVEHDFSEIYGSQSYSTRQLRYAFNVLKEGNWSHRAMEFQKTKLINWLMNSKGKKRLYDDDIPGYYFLAEVESQADFVDDIETGTLSVTFKAYPFMIADLPEGHDIWDSFNFELDVAQQTEFNVKDSLTITLWNVGTPDVIPVINSSSIMSIILNNTTYSVPKGESKSSNLSLKSGENNLIITGNGTISFKFYKELI